MAKGSNDFAGHSVDMGFESYPDAGAPSWKECTRQPKDYPLLRTLLSAPPKCTMADKQELMVQITSTMLFPDPVKREASPLQRQPRRGPSRGKSRIRQINRREKEPLNSDSDQRYYSSPDTTVASPVKPTFSDSGWSCWSPEETEPLSRDQQDFLFNLLVNHCDVNDPRIFYLAANMGISERQVIQWISGQFMPTSRSEAFSYQTTTVADPTFHQTQPVALRHNVHGVVEYYPMVRQNVYSLNSHYSTHTGGFEPQKKRIKREMAYLNQSYNESAFHTGFSSTFYPSYDVQYVQGQVFHENAPQTFIQSPKTREQQPDPLRYHIYSPPAEEPAQQAPATPQGSYQNPSHDSLFWEDLESSVQSNSPLQHTPVYEDLSPVLEAPSSGVFPIGANNQEVSNNSGYESNHHYAPTSSSHDPDLIPIGSSYHFSDSPTKAEQKVKEFLELF